MKKQDVQKFSTWYEKKAKKQFVTKNPQSQQKKDFEKEKKVAKSEKSKNQKKQKPDAHPKKKSFMNVMKTESLLNPLTLSDDEKKIIDDFQSIINSTHPLNSKQRSQLADNIRDLSHVLTDQRAERRLGYMNNPSTLLAYVHYFLWWNLVRLTRLFSNLPKDFFALDENDVCLDIGSGPFTVPLALYISRPELRTKKLKWYCLDISSQALSIGENLMMTVASSLDGEMWNMIRIKGDFGTEIKEKATFVSCANVFNEILESSQMPPDYQAKKCVQSILPYIDSAKKNARILLVEPGVPASARFLSLTRDAFMKKDFIPLSPCPHSGVCPMDGKRGGKWCNFAFSTEDAPKELKKISEKSNLSKERAVLSFLALQKTQDEVLENNLSELVFRIESDPIRLQKNRTGYYACSRLGLLLVITKTPLFYGDCLTVASPKKELPVDEKSGALILNID